VSLKSCSFASSLSRVFFYSQKPEPPLLPALLYDVPLKVTPTLSQWTAVTHDEVEKMIGSALNKTCQLDPVPTWLVKDVGQLLSPFITLLFNKSLASGIFPSDFKHAVVHPLLKKNGLGVSDPKNFRPVSNLSFLSKVLERLYREDFRPI